MSFISKKKTAIPGFGLTMGITILALSLLVLLPLSMLVIKGASLSFSKFIEIITSQRAIASYKLSFWASFIAAFVNVVFGTLVAWVLVRYKFPFKRVVDALVDLPFALPTAVAGITLTSLYSVPVFADNIAWYNGYFGVLLDKIGIKVAFTPLGVIVALIFIGLPFVVRSVQPVLQDLEPELEEASLCMGASRARTFFKVILPNLIPAILSGFSLAFARALGEYGSVVFISGNMPMKTEIIPLLIMTRLEQYDYLGATAFAIVMLAVSFTLMLLVNFISFWSSNKYKSYN